MVVGFGDGVEERLKGVMRDGRKKREMVEVMQGI